MTFKRCATPGCERIASHEVGGAGYCAAYPRPKRTAPCGCEMIEVSPAEWETLHDLAKCRDEPWRTLRRSERPCL